MILYIIDGPFNGRIYTVNEGTKKLIFPVFNERSPVFHYENDEHARTAINEVVYNLYEFHGSLVGVSVTNFKPYDNVEHYIATVLLNGYGIPQS